MLQSCHGLGIVSEDHHNRNRACMSCNSITHEMGNVVTGEHVIKLLTVCVCVWWMYWKARQNVPKQTTVTWHMSVTSCGKRFHDHWFFSLSTKNAYSDLRQMSFLPLVFLQSTWPFRREGQRRTWQTSHLHNWQHTIIKYLSNISLAHKATIQK